MSESPAPTAVTLPDGDTVATAVFEDCQVPALVTDCVVPFDNVAAALNCCALPPMTGVFPVTETALTVGVAALEEGDGAVDDPPEQALIKMAHTVAVTHPAKVLRTVVPPEEVVMGGLYA